MRTSTDIPGLNIEVELYECTLSIMFRTNPGTWKLPVGVFWERT